MTPDAAAPSEHGESESELARDRRAFLAQLTAVGAGAGLFPGVLWAQVVQGVEITKETIVAAESVAGITFTDEERMRLAGSVRGLRRWAAALRDVPLDYSAFPSTVSDVRPPGAVVTVEVQRQPVTTRIPVRARPGSIEELAFATVGELAALVRARRVKPSELTAMYISRLSRFDSQLEAVITLTEERARRQAREADADIAAGRYRGLLHGIPWGAKDIIAVRGYPTTWGAAPYRDQVLDRDATVVQRLDAAGAILIAKLSVGTLASGDRWFGGRTRNPWELTRGSSGSSAGPAAATAAGCVAFALGTDTSGSITAPARTCGVAGHKPTFGRIPRTGVMTLSWSLDTIGPMCRAAEDCALVLTALHGPDAYDRSVQSYAFNWNAALRPSSLRIGYFSSRFERRADDGSVRSDANAMAALRTLEGLGAKLTPVNPPSVPYVDSLSLIDHAEGGTAFREDLRAGRLAAIERGSTWPAVFRMGQFVMASDYITAQRARTELCAEWWKLFQAYDVIVTPAPDTMSSIWAGLPTIVVPSGFAPGPPVGGPPGAPGSPGGPPPPMLPTAIGFIGGLYQEAKALGIAHAFQTATDHHTKHPPLFR